MKKRWVMCGSALLLVVATALTVISPTGLAQRGPQGPAPYGEEWAPRLLELGSRRIGVHDPSTIIKHNDVFWIFTTGSGVRSFHSKDLITWEPGPQVISANPPWVPSVVPPGARRGRGAATGPATAQSAATGPSTSPTTQARGRGGRGGGGVMSFWAPDIIKVGDRYHLYYSCSAFGVNTSAIALATNPTLDPSDPQYKWTDEGIVIQSRRSDNFNAIDPALTFDQENKLWMSFGSFWGGIMLIELDPRTGKRISETAPIKPIAHYSSIEAPFIYYHGGHYYQFVNWGLCCRGVNSTYHIRIGRSDKITGPYLDKEGKDLLSGGGSPFLETEGAMIGPGHAGIIAEGDKYHFGFHFYDGTTPNGRSTYAIRPLTWGADGWPVLGK